MPVSLPTGQTGRDPGCAPPTARIKETLFSTDFIKSGSKQPLWPDTGYVLEDEPPLKNLEGTTFSVFMPIDVAGKTKNYSFVLKIRSMRLEALRAIREGG